MQRPRLYLRARKIAFLVIFNLAVIVAGAELILRVAGKFHPGLRRLLYVRGGSPLSEYSGAANLKELITMSPCPMTPFGRVYDYILNSNGLRTHEYKREKGEGIRRIIMVGDSFLVYGANVREEDHFAAAAATFLRPCAPVEVINLGLPGVGPAFYLRMIEVEGIRLDPDVVVVAFFVGNDFLDEMEPAPIDYPFESDLSLRWYGYRFSRNVYRLFTGAPRPWLWPGDPEASTRKIGGFHLGYIGDPAAGPTLTPSHHRRIQLDRSRVFEDPWPGYIVSQWKKIRVTLGRMKSACVRSQADILLVIIPDESQVSGGLQEMIMSERDSVGYDFDKPQALLSGFCRDNGIEFIDLLPLFRRESAHGESVYSPLDTHWNGHGQRMAAKAIAETIEAKWCPR